MSTPKRIGALQAARQLAQLNKDQAATVLQQQQQKLRAAERQLEQLRAFQADYAAAARRLRNARQLQQYHAFLGRLDSSIAQQQTQVELSQQAVEECRSRWAGCYQRDKALHKVLDKAQKLYRSVIEKRSFE